MNYTRIKEGSVNYIHIQSLVSPSSSDHSGVFSRPREIGHFSGTVSGEELHDDRSSLAALCLPPPGAYLNYDLELGRESFVDHGEGIDKVTDGEDTNKGGVLSFLSKNKNFLLGGQTTSENTVTTKTDSDTPSTVEGGSPSVNHGTPDFVGERSFLTKLFMTPYENYSGWSIEVTKFHGTYYVTEVDPDLAEQMMDESVSQRTENDKEGTAPVTADLETVKKEGITTNVVTATELEKGNSTQPSESADNISPPDDDETVLNSREKDHPACYWGHKFERYITAECPSGQPDIDVPVNTNKAFFSILDGRLGDHKLIYLAEMDCYDPEVFTKGESVLSREEGAALATELANKEGVDSAYVEIKTTRILGHRQAYHDFFCQTKLPGWWAQCVLGNVPRVVCGFRNYLGIVREIRSFKTKDLPRYSMGAWNPNTCMTYANTILTMIKNLDLPDDPSISCILQWKFGTDSKRIRISQFKWKGYYLPEWFVNSINSMHSQAV